MNLAPPYSYVPPLPLLRPSMPTILIVDDEPAIRRSLTDILGDEGYTIEEAENGEEALQKIKANRYDLVLLDIKMPRVDGMEVLQRLANEELAIPVVMLSGHGTIDTAMEATRLGAVDFIEKPPDLNRLLVSIRNALDRGQLQTENRRMRQALADVEQTELTPIIGEHPAIEQIKSTINRVAPTEARVLVTGEAGTGKELVARWIHAQSHRAEGPMVEVNCAAIPGELIESELFGHEKGSFTGATKQRIGKFEQAHGGTLFLDEIGDMSLSAQAKVLRALQESRITRVGGDRSIEVNVRVVAATNKDLLAEIEGHRFREDLYHRLSVILITVPPLRQRKSDIAAIAEYLIHRVALRNGMQPKTFSDDALDQLRTYDWRGNVRELNNVVERLLILSEGDAITGSDVQVNVRASGSEQDPVAGLMDRFDQFSDFRDHAEKVFIERKLNEFDWNISRTAEAIGIQRSHLYNKLNKYGIERDA